MNTEIKEVVYVSAFSRREGIMSFTKCPNCKKHLTPIKKLTDHDVTGSAAKICENFQCWRYTNFEDLMTWKRT